MTLSSLSFLKSSVLPSDWVRFLPQSKAARYGLKPPSLAAPGRLIGLMSGRNELFLLEQALRSSQGDPSKNLTTTKPKPATAIMAPSTIAAISARSLNSYRGFGLVIGRRG